MDFSAVSSALEAIGELTQQVTSLFGVDDQDESLRGELTWMKSFLEVADARTVDNPVMRTSVAEIRELAYDSEDMIATFALKVANKRKGGFSNCIKRSACFLKEACLLHQTRSEIQKITAKIEVLTRRLKTYDVAKLGDHGEGPSTQRREARRPFPHKTDDKIVGMDADIEKLVSVLVEEGSEIRVVSICGMGGLGKTTLAKKIYHHNQVIGHFNHLVWVYVSQQFQRRKVWEEILSSLKTSANVKNKKDEDLAKELEDFLKDEKCLVILDDIWSTKAWDSLEPAFPVEANRQSRSKILITSRNKEIVAHADRRGHLHELQCLSDKHSWDLLQKIAFPQTDSTENSVDARLKELVEEMVKHCAGLPLAIVALGGILVTKDNSLTEWLKVSENVKSYLKRGNSQGPEDVLALSYDDLPPYLRPCFLYLSHFPEDYEISADRLIQLWVAEGIVSSKQEEIAEDEAEWCLMELVERCMIQARKRDVKIKTIHRHDLMRDLCLSKARQESFVFIVDQAIASSISTIRKVRRVSLHEFFWIQGIKSPNLRSLLFFDKFILDEALVKLMPQTMVNYEANHGDKFWNPLVWIVRISFICVVAPKVLGVWSHMCNNFKLLRVLNYEGRIMRHDGAGFRLPSDIGNLIHLRFLSLRGLEFLWWKLPSSLGNLRCLQTLDLRLHNEIGSVHVPNVIWRMEQLRHLYLPEDCSDKTKLKLATLRNLQTLVNFNSKSCYVEDLIYMTNLRELVIDGPFEIDGFNAEELDKNPPIIEGRHLHSLAIISYTRLDPRHLNYLLSSCVSLCKLSLDAEISELPKYDHLSSDLAYIKLKRCKLQEDPMPTLQKLPNLRFLKLHREALRTNIIFCSAPGFPKLESLKIKEISNLEEWNVDEGAMPCLRRLVMDYCPNLKMVPDGLRFITTLQELKIKRMEKAFKDRVEEGGEDFYKVQHVPSIIFRGCDK